MSEKIETEEANDKNWYVKNLEKVLQDNEKWVKVDDLDIWPACSPGENFVAEVLRVVVYGRRMCLGTWTDIRKNFIVKRLPGLNSPCRTFYDCLKMFQNEIAFYEHVLPMCQSYLEKKSQNEINELNFPKFYGQCQHFLVLQDLQTEGYQVVNRVKGFSMRECSLILQELSKFHALSFALKKHENVTFWKNVERLKEAVFLEKLVNTLTEVFWENPVKMAIRSLEESQDPRLSKASEILKSHSGQIFNSLINIIKPDLNKFEVICHGDLWSNNILLRYCESGYPIGVKFIDLQATRYGSCVLDVMHVLFTSSRPIIYERHLYLLLIHYYNSLTSNLKNLDMSPGFTFEEFVSEFKRKISFGVLLACVMLACVTRTSFPEISSLTESQLSTDLNVDKIYKFLSPEYHKRLRSLFSALVDSGFI